MKFISREVEIEAEQFIEGIRTPPGVLFTSEGVPYVVTIHGQETEIEIGDYIIREPDGVHYYPCQPEIFEKRYKLKEGK